MPDSRDPASPSLFAEIMPLVAGAVDLAHLLDSVARTLHARSVFPLVAIYLDDPVDDALTLCAVAGAEDCPASAYRLPRRVPVDTLEAAEGNFLRAAIRSGRVTLCAPAERLPILHPAPLHAAVPLTLPPHSAETLETPGVLWLAVAPPDSLPPDEALALLGGIITLGIRNARSYARERARAEREAVVNRLSRAVGSSLKLDEVQRLAVDLVGNHLNADVCGFVEMEPATRVGRIRHPYQNPLYPDQPPAALTAPIPLGRALDWFRKMKGSGQAGALYEHSIPRPLRPLFEHLRRAYRVRSLAASLIPEMDSQRQYALVVAQTTHARVWQEDELAFLQGLAAQLGVALRNALLHEQALAAGEQLRDTNAELEAFIYTASHDLQAPIVSLQGFATLITERYGSDFDERGRMYLQRLAANAAALGELMHDLLEISRIGRLEDPDEPVRVGEIVNLALAQYGVALEERAARVQMPECWPTVMYSRRRLLQVFGNLISNAVKFLGDQPEPVVEIGWRAENGRDRFWVRDNGIGIDPADQGRIFEPFRRLERLKVEGTGVGLNIVKRIVERRGGRIEVESTPGRGATFTFTVPKRPA